MMNGYGYEHGFGGGFMWIIWLALIVLIIWGAKSMGSSESSSSKPSALDILKERYARGEISEQEFEQMKNNLK